MLLYELQQLLVQIKTCSEVGDTESQHTIAYLAKHGLKMLHYALYAIENNQTELPFTSISAAATIHAVCEELDPLAKTYGASISFEASSNLEPVYANETSLRGAMYALAAGAITSSINGIAPKITFAVQQTKPNEQRIGVYSDTIRINLKSIKNTAKDWHAVRRMSANGTIHAGGLGYAVSQLLASQLHTSFASFEHKQSAGVGFYLPESAQLSLV